MNNAKPIHGITIGTIRVTTGVVIIKDSITDRDGLDRSGLRDIGGSSPIVIGTDKGN